jgi:hypothetical protein
VPQNRFKDQYKKEKLHPSNCGKNSCKDIIKGICDQEVGEKPDNKFLRIQKLNHLRLALESETNSLSNDIVFDKVVAGKY